MTGFSRSSVLLVLTIQVTWRMRHKYQVIQGLYTPPQVSYGMGGIQSHSMESIWNVFWLVTQPFFYSIPTKESIRKIHGTVHSICILWTGPCGIHGISNIFILQIYVLFHLDFMEASTVARQKSCTTQNNSISPPSSREQLPYIYGNIHIFYIHL